MNAGYTVRTALGRIVKKIKAATNKLNNHHVQFSTSKQVHIFHKTEMPVWVTYDFGADGHYLNETDRARAGLPILKPLKKRVGVADGGVSVGTHVTHLTFPQLPHKESTADTVTYFPNSPMSVGTTSDDDTVSVFAKDGVKFYYREDVLITCKNKPILIEVRNICGCYRIPLQQR